MEYQGGALGKQGKVKSRAHFWSVRTEMGFHFFGRKTKQMRSHLFIRREKITTWLFIVLVSSIASLLLLYEEHYSESHEIGVCL
jgi:hypothetical protein